ncbi:uncharacterized protein ANIA_11409 [Aspergillus nidulans FGSC A4]|uniref:Uncharacterized protein n=1 Tax=Emericella nidulans (strain FGSC A4 / ATCC 38163 / CBS 112.46 / NRRL 194 / M139) TaxID=227321 RepID=C8V7M4_EMENI|nr:hypothetical protein [Aspergillus nidulans FGSC A4]CBF75611.1 TPA: hypothetical protein ANIA_11409 [Aspergillus nidulans FGSC A4]
MPTAGMGEAWADGCKSGSFTLSGKPQSLGDEVRTVTGLFNSLVFPQP